jgi:O-antigen ligase
MFLYYLLLFMSPFYHHPIFDRGFGSFTLVKGVGTTCAAFSLIYLIRRGEVPSYFQTRQAKLFLVLCGIAFVSYALEGETRGTGSSAAFSYLSFLVFFFVTVTLVESLKKLWWSLAFALAGVALGGLYMIREFTKYRGRYGDFRPGHVVGDPNYFALAALLIVPVAYFWLVARRAQSSPLERISRWAAFGMLIPISVAFVLASSRGALVALLAFFGFVVWHSRSRLRNGLLILVPTALLSILLPQSPIHRFLNPTYGDQTGQETRIEAWKAGLNMVKQNPLFGIGLGLFKPQLGEYADDPNMSQIAHNTGLEIAAELGIPALLVFVGFLWESYRSLDRIRRAAERKRDPILYPLAAGLEGGLIAFIVGGFFISAQYVKLFWLCAFLSIPLLRVARERMAEGRLSDQVSQNDINRNDPSVRRRPGGQRADSVPHLGNGQFPR